MATQKRFTSFTLCRTQFWLFFLAGLSMMTLVPLFNNTAITVGGLLAAVLVMGVTAAARLRDLGCSAWYTPLIAIPLVAVYAGTMAADAPASRADQVQTRMVTASVFSVALSLSWLVATSAQ